MAGQKNGVKFPASLPIEVLRGRCLLLGHVAVRRGENQWWYLDDGGIVSTAIIKVVNGRYGRDTERQVLEEVLRHYGVPDGH